LFEGTVKTAWFTVLSGFTSILSKIHIELCPTWLPQQKEFLPRQIMRMSSVDLQERVENSPRIANCFTGSFGGPRDCLFTILKAATRPSQPRRLSMVPLCNLGSEHGRPRSRG
jgi:hypothetical protein